MSCSCNKYIWSGSEGEREKETERASKSRKKAQITSNQSKQRIYLPNNECNNKLIKLLLLLYGTFDTLFAGILLKIIRWLMGTQSAGV
jgi:hypothetical protein